MLQKEDNSSMKINYLRQGGYVLIGAIS